ncbi:hypothetical protein EF294_05760 [Gordonia oryzae]|uniref:Uncharacterized protein n=1 Tax=Gordonia oryzae TaxID=2487349 RepID=A0A3N4GWW2_9ACTN|nr:hypothetical protein EF294_05760 [Gordonia oryzae]
MQHCDAHDALRDSLRRRFADLPAPDNGYRHRAGRPNSSPWPIIFLAVSAGESASGGFGAPWTRHRGHTAMS